MESDFKDLYHRYYLDYEPYDAFLFHAYEELSGISVTGKKVLEIGCGRGAFSLFLALAGGAERVVALDEAEGFGSDKEHLKRFAEIIECHAIGGIEIIKADITTPHLFPDESFDLIVSNFAMHHLLDPHRDGGAKNDRTHELVGVFKMLNRYLKKGSRMVLREMSGINFWRYMPYHWKMSHIEWELHPSLTQWLRLLRNAGFEEIGHTFLTPFALSQVPPFLVRNSFANFFFSSSFYLYGTK